MNQIKPKEDIYMKKRLINFFSETTNVLLLLSTIIGLVLIVMLINATEAFTPPNEDDYKELHYLEEDVRSNFDNVYSMDNAEILIKEKKIVVEITSKQSSYYKIAMEFDKERNFVKSNEICTKRGFETTSSKIGNKIWFVLSWVLMTIFVIGFTYILVCICFEIFRFLSNKIAIIFKKQKRKLKK